MLEKSGLHIRWLRSEIYLPFSLSQFHSLSSGYHRVDIFVIVCYFVYSYNAIPCLYGTTLYLLFRTVVDCLFKLYVFRMKSKFVHVYLERREILVNNII